MLSALPLLLALPLDDDFRRDEERRHMEGSPPPAIELAEWIGERPESYDGQVLLIHYWGWWDERCRREVPRVNELLEVYREEGFQVLGVHTSDGWDKAPDYISSHGITYPVGHDEHRKVLAAFDVQSFPEFHLVDRSGNLRFCDLDSDDLELAVQHLLKADKSEAVLAWVEEHPDVIMEHRVEDEVQIHFHFQFSIDEEEELVIVNTRRTMGDKVLDQRSAARLSDLGLIELEGVERTDLEIVNEYRFQLERGEWRGEVGDAAIEFEAPKLPLASPGLTILHGGILPFEQDAVASFMPFDGETGTLAPATDARYVKEEDKDEKALHRIELVRDELVIVTVWHDADRKLVAMEMDGMPGEMRILD